MQRHEINLPERDKLAAGYGRVSDVFDYYPEGIIFPVFIDESMSKVSVIPDGNGYLLYAGTGRNTGEGMRGTTCALFSEVVDHARDLLLDSPVKQEKKLFSFLPLPA